MDMDTLEHRVSLFRKYLQYSGLAFKQYQEDGVRWCLHNELRTDPPENIRGGFIADEMGLGKTILMLGLVVCHYVPKTLIVLPIALLEQWYSQIYRTTGHKPLVFHGTDKKKITLDMLEKSILVITTYDMISLSKKKREKRKKNDKISNL